MSDDDSAGGAGDSPERCGETTTMGTPCQNLAESCPWDHGSEATNDGRGRPAYDPDDYREEVATHLEAGDVIPVACAKAGISEATYHKWCRKGREEDAEPTFVDFKEATTRARKAGAGAELDELEKRLFRAEDTRTNYKLFLKKHGSVLFGEDGDRDPEAANVVVDIPTELLDAPDVPEAYRDEGDG